MPTPFDFDFSLYITIISTSSGVARQIFELYFPCLYKDLPGKTWKPGVDNKIRVEGGGRLGVCGSDRPESATAGGRRREVGRGDQAPSKGDERFRAATAVEATSRKAREVDWIRAKARSNRG
jgi:hypothetical protein